MKRCHFSKLPCVVTYQVEDLHLGMSIAGGRDATFRGERLSIGDREDARMEQAGRALEP